MKDTKEIFIEYSKNHGEAIENGDHKTANKFHSKLSSLYEKIKKSDDWGILEEVVESSDESVQLWAATFLLKHNSAKAEKVLNGLKKSQKIVGMTASTTLDLWKKGMLQL